MQEISENSRAVCSSDYWQRFVCTGRVEDYLRYSGTRSQGALQAQSGADPHAGFYHGNRNDIETDAYR